MAAAFVINTGLQPSAYRVKRFQPFQRLSSLGVIKQAVETAYPSNRIITGLKAGVN
jgi:hypothetical protein